MIFTENKFLLFIAINYNGIYNNGICAYVAQEIICLDGNLIIFAGQCNITFDNLNTYILHKIV